MRTGLALSVLWGAGCEDLLGQKDGFSDDEWTAIEKIEPLKGPGFTNTFNSYADSEPAAKLGQMLFFDPDFSTPIKVDGLLTGKKGDVGKVACVTCHDPEHSYVDTRPQNIVSHGTGVTTRNSPPLVNLKWYSSFTWGGRMDSMSTQGANAPEAGTDVATSRLLFAHVAYKKYRDEFRDVFGFTMDPALDPAAPDAMRFPPAGRPKAAMSDPNGPWEGMKPEDQLHVNQIMAFSGKAFEAFERKLVSPNSPFQRYVKGNHDALTAEQKAGLRLFIGKATCIDCHTGPVLSDNQFHVIGVPAAVPPAPQPDPARATRDTGRLQDLPPLVNNGFNGASVFSDDRETGQKLKDKNAAELMRNNAAAMAKAGSEPERGKYRTPGLTNISDTAPYFHNGSAATLEDVVHFYNVGGGALGTYEGVKDVRIRPLGLTSAEERHLVAFLKSLMGEPFPAELRANTAKPSM